MLDDGDQTGGLANATRDLTAIIDHALAMEKQSILFYVGMKDRVVQRSGVAAVDQIIEEEIGHVGWLYDYRHRMKKSA